MATSMIKICTVYFQGMYSPQYVTNLYRSLKKHSTVDFEFICLSDTDDIEADVVLPYNHHTYIKLHWHKLKYFCELFANQQPGDDIIVMDIDQLIVSNIDELLQYPVQEHQLLSYNKWWDTNPKPPVSINGGFYKFKSGSLNFVWNKFIEDPEYWQLHYYNANIVQYKYYGEQNFVEFVCKENGVEILQIPGLWVGKYTNDDNINKKLNMMYADKFGQDYMVLDTPNDHIKILHFANPNSTIHDSKEQWVKDNWTV